MIENHTTEKRASRKLGILIFHTYYITVPKFKVFPLYPVIGLIHTLRRLGGKRINAVLDKFKIICPFIK